MVQISTRFVLFGALFGLTMASPIALTSQPQVAVRALQGYEYMMSSTQTTPVQGKYLVPSSEVKRGEERVGTGLHTKAPVHQRGVNMLKSALSIPRDMLSKRQLPINALGNLPGNLPGNVNPSSLVNLLEGLPPTVISAIVQLLQAEAAERGSTQAPSLPKASVLEVINPGADFKVNEDSLSKDTGNGGSPNIVFLTSSKPLDGSDKVSSDMFKTGTPLSFSGAATGKSTPKGPSSGSFNGFHPEIMAVDR